MDLQQLSPRILIIPAPSMILAGASAWALFRALLCVS